MVKIIPWLKFQIFDKCCPECGSESIVIRGFESINRRIECLDCKKTIRVEP